MVASRCPYRLDLRAAAIKPSTSAPVRYSRVRPTEEFTMVGGVVLSASKAMKIPIPRFETEESIIIYSSVPRREEGRVIKLGSFDRFVNGSWANDLK